MAAVCAMALGLLASCTVEVDDDASTRRSPESAAPPRTGANAAPEQRIARDIFERVNAERRARDLDPLGWDETLTHFAREWSDRMRKTGEFEHRELDQLMQQDEMAGFQAAGENIFQATGPVTAGHMHAGWMRSDGHRRNVLQPGFDRIGIGAVCATDGSVYATQQFGRTRGSDHPPIADETPPEEPITRPEPDGPTC